MIEELIILTNIIFITIILTADNAVIVGSIASNFVPKNRKQIILWGVIGAFVFKIFFAVFATFLFEFYFIKILGGLLLIWIVNDLRKDLLDIKKVKPTTKKTKELLFGKLSKGGLVIVSVKDNKIKLGLKGPEKRQISRNKPPLLTAS